MRSSRSNKSEKSPIRPNLSLKNRFWLFQIVVILIILAGIFIIASFSGVISDLAENPYHNVASDLEYIESELSKKCLTISNSTVELADRLNRSIGKQLQSKGLKPGDLKNHPELIEMILSSEVEKSCFAMEKAGVTGVFVFLDATINPNLECANYSKAGFYIVNMDHNPVPYESQQLFLLYGPVNLARDNTIHLHTQWELEFNIAPDVPKRRRDLFQMPFDAALANYIPDPYYLGYWNPLFIPSENTDSVVSYSVPLLDSNGYPYGVCGLDISKPAFENILYQKSSHEFDREVLIYSTQMGTGINMENALVCGSNSSWLVNGDSKHLYISLPSDKESLNDYYFSTPLKDKILGLDINVRVYPTKSVFKDTKWTLALLLPKSDVTAKTARLFYVASLLLLLLAASVVITFFSSKYCISPLMDAIKKIKYNEPQVKTNITEIDDLIKFLEVRADPQVSDIKPQTGQPLSASVSGNMLKKAELSPHVNAHILTSYNRTEHYSNELPTAQDSLQQEVLSPEQYKKFEDQLQTLTNAERRIFDLYIEGHDAKEICKILYISINTLKTHNRRIYTKMNVSSRAELLKYCNELMGKI